MRKLLIFLLILSVSLVACGGEEAPPPPPIDAEVSAPTDVPAAEPTDTPTESPTDVPAETDDAMDSDAINGDDMAGDEMAGDDMAGDEMAGDDMAGDGMAGDDMAGDDMAGDDMAGDGMAGDAPDEGSAPAEGEGGPGSGRGGRGGDGEGGEGEGEGNGDGEGDEAGETADSGVVTSEGGNAMAIPPLLDYTVTDDGAKEFDLVMQMGTMEFVEGIESETMGFNGDYLGPTIRVNEGDSVVINVTNEINDDTSVHWHGLHVPPEMDGSAHQLIMEGGSWTVNYDILNEASTMWYHPHPHGTSAIQVSYGLAGMYIIDDENSLSLDIPQMYGVDDIPLVIQDRKFEEGVMVADPAGGLYYGTEMFANGTLDAYLDVPAKMVRLRIINGSLSRQYALAFDDGREFFQIATDGGLVESPVPLTSMLLATGERTELVVDLSDGAEVTLQTLDDDRLDSDNGGEYDILRLVPDVSHDMAESDPTLPDVLNTIEWWTEEDADNVREMPLGGQETAEEDPTDIYIAVEHDAENSGKAGIPINGKVMDMTRIDEIVMVDDIEIWEFTNNGDGHPLHIHDVQYQVLDRNGEPPEAYERGWKDTVWVGDGDTVRVIMQFDTFANEAVPYMYHCHILQHEDGGMMGQFIVVDEEAVANGAPSILDYTYSMAELRSYGGDDFFENFDPLVCAIPGT